MDHIFLSVKMIKYLTVTELLYIAKSKYTEHLEEEELNIQTSEFWIFFYIELGNMDLLYKNEVINLKKGDAFYIEPNAPFAHRDYVSAIYYKYTFAAKSSVLDFLSGKKFKLPTKIIKYVYIVYNEALNSFFDYRSYDPDSIYPLRSVVRSTARPCWQQYICLYLELTAIDLMRKYNSNETRFINHTQDINNIATKIAKFLDVNVYNQLSLTNICTKFMYSKVTLTQEFKKIYGCTIIGYFNHLKINEAKRLIQENNHIFSEIAEILRFSNEKYFAVVFKRYTKMTPMEYKRYCQETTTTTTTL